MDTLQPSVPPEFFLLATGYPIGDLSVDLYGERPDSYGGYNVCAITLTGSTVNIADLVDQYKLDALSCALDAAHDFAPVFRMPVLVLPAMLRVQAAA